MSNATATDLVDSTRRPSQPRRNRWLLAVDVSFFVTAMVIAITSGWPTYQHPAYLTCVAVAVFAGVLLASVLTKRWRIKARYVWLCAAAIYLCVGIPAAIPSALWSFPTNLGSGLHDLVTAPVTAWKLLVTLDLPVGNFSAVLVPAFIVFLLAATWFMLAQLRRPELVWVRVLAATLPLLFSITTGPELVSRTITIRTWELHAARESAIGALWALVVLVWLSVRRRVAVERVKNAATDAKTRRRLFFVPATRALAGAVTLCLALVVALGFAPTLTDQRKVIRTYLSPSVVQPQVTSPLSSFRTYFSGTDLDRVLFRIAGEEIPDRVRIATMPWYRGDVYSVVDPANPDSDFRRLAYKLTGISGQQSTFEVTVGEYTGQWLPTVGQVVSVSFAGPDARHLQEHLYASRSTTGVLVTAPRTGAVSGLKSGDRYRLTAVMPNQDTAGRSPRVESPWTSTQLPSLYRWLESFDKSLETVADVREVVDQMMWASYLSHSLTDPNELWGPGNWIDVIDNDTFTFEPSYAGHNLQTIDEQIFDKLADPARHVCTGPEDTRCAAVVGDEEQFAVAIALIGQAAGFPSRVVLGATPSQDGVVRAQDITAWAEVQAADGAWITIDATPRTDNAFEDTENQPTPNQYSNPVHRDAQPNIPLPDVRAQSGSGSTSTLPDALTPTVSEPSWQRWLRPAGLSLLALVVLTSPIWIVLLVKSMRFRKRRRGSAEDQITGGWDEYVDRMIDVGQPRLSALTRSESAQIYATQYGEELASRADQAVFADVEPEPRQAEEFWQLLQADLADQRARLTRWQKVRARISWRFLTQHDSRVKEVDTEENEQ